MCTIQPQPPRRPSSITCGTEGRRGGRERGEAARTDTDAPVIVAKEGEKGMDVSVGGLEKTQP